MTMTSGISWIRMRPSIPFLLLVRRWIYYPIMGQCFISTSWSARRRICPTHHRSVYNQHCWRGSPSNIYIRLESQRWRKLHNRSTCMWWIAIGNWYYGTGKKTTFNHFFVSCRSKGSMDTSLWAEFNKTVILPCYHNIANKVSDLCWYNLVTSYQLHSHQLYNTANTYYILLVFNNCRTGSSLSNNT